MADRLDPRDQALLRDIEAFNAAYAGAGWHLQDRVLTEDLSQIRLARSSMTAVRLLHVKLNAARLTDSRFVNADFRQTSFSGAELRNVMFINCRFRVCSFEKAALANCIFINCMADEAKARNATFENCSFESFEDRSGVFGSAVLHNCRFERCRMDNSSFYETTFDAVSLKQSMLTNVVFSGIRGTGFAFEGSVVQNCGFEDSRYGSLSMDRGKSRGLTFNGFDATRLRIQDCESIEALTVTGCTWIGPSITGCHAVSEFSMDRSRMQDLTMSDNQVAYLAVEETEVLGASRIADCRFVGLSVARSRMRGTQFLNCGVAGYLIADGATLDAVGLHGMTYAQGLRISAQDVTYSNDSGRFVNP